MTHRMKRLLITLVVLAGVFAAGAEASSGWRVFATGQDQGDYSAFASADASVTRPHGLAVRVNRQADVSWTVSCDGRTHLPADRILVVTVAAAGTCHLYASGSTDSPGMLRVQLLRK